MPRTNKSRFCFRWQLNILPLPQLCCYAHQAPRIPHKHRLAPTHPSFHGCLKFQDYIVFSQVSLPVDMRPLPKEPEEKQKHKPHKIKKSKDHHHEKPNISYPTKFTHVVHVGFDDDSGEFTGMPEAWTKLLVASNISKEMQMQNPQAVLDVLNYYEHSSKKTEDKYMTQTPSTDPSPRPSYSVSSHALSSPSSQSSQPVSGNDDGRMSQRDDESNSDVLSGVSPSPPVSCASVPSPVLPEPPLGPTSTAPATRLTSSSSNTPSVFSTTPDQVTVHICQNSCS